MPTSYEQSYRFSYLDRSSPDYRGPRLRHGRDLGTRELPEFSITSTLPKLADHGRPLATLVGLACGIYETENGYAGSSTLSQLQHGIRPVTKEGHQMVTGIDGEEQTVRWQNAHSRLSSPEQGLSVFRIVGPPDLAPALVPSLRGGE